MSSNCDVLFLHVPKFSNFYKPLDEFMNITYIPMGVFALADLAAREKLSVQIVHAGLEWILDRNFSIIEHIRKNNKIKVVFMPLFWHYQSYDVISVARKIKENFPHIQIFLGGFTSSYFADEITAAYPFIDGVLKGYSESGVRAIAKQITEAGSTAPLKLDYSKIPNLVVSKEKLSNTATRQSGDCNQEQCPISVTSETEFNSLRFSAISLLKNFSYYIKLFSFPLAYSKNMSMRENIRLNNMGLVMFPVEIGRGCSVSCSWCAGSAPNQKRMNNNSRVMWRAPEKVADTFAEAVSYGYRTIALCFDPEPKEQAYYLELFDILRRRKIDCGLYFECYSLPNKKFIESFRETFKLSESVIAISPECGNEEVRKLNKGFYFSNAELFESLNLLSYAGIKTDVFFTMGIPSENINTLYDTKTMITKIGGRYKNIGRMMTWGIQMEPGSPIFQDPEKFGVITDRKTFSDFYNLHGGFNSDTYSALGYSVKNYFLDGKTYSTAEFSEKIMKIKCADFCFLHNDCSAYNTPAVGRLTCKLRALMFKLKGFGKKCYENKPRAEFK